MENNKLNIHDEIIDAGFQKDLANALEWIVLFQSALAELVELKKIKDAEGKTPDYEHRQPLAWEHAFEIMEMFKKDDGFIHKPQQLQKGFENWIKTGKGKRLLNAVIINQPEINKRNCLWWTYQAGAASGEISLTREVAEIMQQLLNRKTISVSLQRRIKYIIDHKEEYTIDK